ncbi:phenylalanine--tRNA ligase subunit alpha [Candidatus Dojkabacteria bacterium]|uniref:Phenylalanine--tRNA ligase alpha subunit n=1 Tax=Candidatus Dojkabacteria bacterium TaxID=2099670 RepID=A0A955L3E1_9BACT|nr:phenylalanine--tRNA ligase subunit alpha [Candidatus Dojkabacteria bacterium]
MNQSDERNSNITTQEFISSLEKIQEQFYPDIETVDTEDKLNEIRIKYLGRKSDLSKLLSSLKDLPKEDRKEAGGKSNQLKQEIEAGLNRRQEILIQNKIHDESNTTIDETIPGVEPQLGSIHPLTQIRFKVEDIFQKMGFEIIEPFEIDNDYNTFTALNIPVDHPARDMWDTFWTEDKNIPITHTSSMQNRILKGSEPPIRAIVPGKCFRNEATDASHEHTFYQVEGVYVDKGITFTDMIGTLQEFLRNYFEKDVEMAASIFSDDKDRIETRIQPSFFPFVEPAIEIMIKWRVGNEDKWLEVIPCGPIHPQVLIEGGLDPEVYSGFAWGFGLDRLVMIKYGLEDIRNFHGGDLRFLKQF